MSKLLLDKPRPLRESPPESVVAPPPSQPSTQIDEEEASTGGITGGGKEEKKGESIRSLLESVILDLTEAARVVEKLDEAPTSIKGDDSSVAGTEVGGEKEKARLKEKKRRLQENLKKFAKRLRKLNSHIPESTVLNCNLPIGLIRHVDDGRSPNTWLSEAYSAAQMENNKARGELLAVASLKTSLCAFLEGQQMFPDGPLPPDPLMSGSADTPASTPTPPQTAGGDTNSTPKAS